MSEQPPQGFDFQSQYVPQSLLRHMVDNHMCTNHLFIPDDTRAAEIFAARERTIPGIKDQVLGMAGWVWACSMLGLGYLLNEDSMRREYATTQYAISAGYGANYGNRFRAALKLASAHKQIVEGLKQAGRI